MRIALTGNPNSGKTTMFNALTGQNEKVGKWAGVTVEKKAQAIKKSVSGGEELIAVDLPIHALPTRASLPSLRRSNPTRRASFERGPVQKNSNACLVILTYAMRAFVLFERALFTKGKYF